ncbi:MAG: DUF599 family protein [Pseudomonadota bacterium]
MKPFFSTLDWVALGWFFVIWVGYSLLADHSKITDRSITTAVNKKRKQWMEQMLLRDLRMVDTQIMGNLGNGIAFFASTSILIVGGLSAALASGTQAVSILKDLPFASNSSVLGFEAKVLLLIAIFIYAFIKFSWSFRLSNYCSILIGAAPTLPDGSSMEQVSSQAELPARISGLLGAHFNRGLRSYFFALAVLPWFIHPLGFIASTTLVAVMQYRREFASRSLRFMQTYS